MTDVHAPVMAAGEATALATARGRTVEQLMDDLLTAARAKAIAPVSGFAVGAVARGRSGALYLGANLEFPGHPLNAAVHAEQSAVASAWMHGERGVQTIATSAMPCGHCRQFLTELHGADSLRILVHGGPPLTLGELLPASFGPGDLGVARRLMDAGETAALRSPEAPPEEHADRALVDEALRAAAQSYAPYGKTLAGVALALDDRSVEAGRAAECAAFNPSLSPLQVALSGLALEGVGFENIRRAALVETGGPVSYRAATEALLATVAPGVRLLYVAAVPA